MTKVSTVGDSEISTASDWLRAGFSLAKLAGAGTDKQLATYIAGSETAQVILFNHSILTDSRVWKDQAMRALSLGYRVVCVDFRGHGASYPFSPPYTMQDLVADNVSVLDDLKIERAHFAGVSLGGMVGLGMGILHPDRVQSLCLCASRGDAPAAFAAGWNDRIALATKEGTGALIQSTCERWLGSGYASHPYYGLIAQMIGDTSTEGFIGSAQAIQKLDFLDDAAGISAPTTLIVGQNDTGMLQPMHALRDIIDGSRLEAIPNAGHLPQLDDPDKFAGLLFGHLKAASRPVAG